MDFGTDYRKRNGDALNNCWFIAIRPQPMANHTLYPKIIPPAAGCSRCHTPLMFDELMKGGGVGFRVTRDILQSCQPVATKFELTVVIDRNSASYADLLKKWVQLTVTSGKKHMPVNRADHCALARYARRLGVSQRESDRPSF